MSLNIKFPDKFARDPNTGRTFMISRNPNIELGAYGKKKVYFVIKEASYWQSEDKPYTDEEIISFGISWDYSKLELEKVKDERGEIVNKLVDQFPPTVKNIISVREKLKKDAFDAGKESDHALIDLKTCPRAMKPSDKVDRKLNAISAEDRFIARLTRR